MKGILRRQFDPGWELLSQKKSIECRRVFFFILSVQANMSTTATKAHPKLWERAKREVCRSSTLLCRHSARKMQAAGKWYRDHGGKYSGRKSSHNSLVKWTRQKWRTSDGSLSRGDKRYLPAKAWSKLSPSQVKRTNHSKREGNRRGRQYVAQPKDVLRVVRAISGKSRKK